MSNHFKLKAIRALIIDIDGTLWRGKRPLPGLAPFFEFLSRYKVSFVIVTNNSVKTPDQYREKLAGFGVDLPVESILTSGLTTAAYLKQKKADALIYVIGEAGLRQALRQAGFSLSDRADPEVAVVVVGGDRSLSYEKLKDAVLCIQRGAQFVGTNPDVLVPTEEGLVPEAGTTLAALEAATRVAPMIIGKPERYLFELAIKKMAAAPPKRLCWATGWTPIFWAGSGPGSRPSC